MVVHHSRRLIALPLALLLPVATSAQGFGLNEIGSCAVSRAGAVTGAPCADASLIYWSPGSGTTLKGFSFLIGGAAVAVGGAFHPDTTRLRYNGDAPTEFPPHVFLNWHQAGQRFSLGVGAYLPYGLTSQWRGDFPGRFSALKASLRSLYVQPNVSLDLDDRGHFSIGGGPVIARSSVELRQALDLAPLPTRAGGPTFGQLGIPLRTEFAQVALKGSATAYGYNLGAHWQASDAVQVNARYLSSLTFEYNDADATFSQSKTGLTLPAFNPFGLPPGTPVDALLAPQFTAGALVAQKVKTSIQHPAQTQVGLGYSGFRNTVLSLDGSYVRWTSFKELPVLFQGPAAASSRTLYEDYKDSYGIRGSIDHSYANGWSARAGISYLGTPAPDETVTPLLPDMNRTNLALGTAIPIGGQAVLDIGYLAVLTRGRRGRIVERTDRTQTADQLNGGYYNLNANVFSASLKAQF
ncbi:MAG: outer membrane protein transport protein [Gemmatimonadaceae bacterium]